MSDERKGRQSTRLPSVSLMPQDETVEPQGMYIVDLVIIMENVLMVPSVMMGSLRQADSVVCCISTRGACNQVLVRRGK